MTSFSIGPALFFQDSEGIETGLRIAQQNEDLIYLIVTDDSNRVISSYKKTAAG